MNKNTIGKLILIGIRYYNSNNESDNATINRFIDVATHKKLDDEELDKLHKKIAIVQYDSETKLHAFKLDRLD